MADPVPSIANAAELPGEPMPQWPLGSPPRRVDLPLRACPRRALLAGVALLYGFVGLLGLAMAAVLPFGASPAEPLTLLALAVVWPMGAALAVVGLGIAWTSLADAVRPSPFLVLDGAGLRDARAGVTVPWPAIARASGFATGAGLGAVRLALRGPVAAKRARFRLGTFGASWRHRPDELVVGVMLLDVPALTLAQLILTLVRQHGGEADTAGPKGGVLVPILPAPGVT